MKTPAKTKPAAPKAAAKPAAPKRDPMEARMAFVENAVRVIATRLYGPNGGGPEHVAEAEALFSDLIGA